MAKAARSCEVLRLETRNLSTGHDVEKPKLLDGPYARIFGILTWPDRPLPRPSAWRPICVRPKKAAGGLGELVWVACSPTGLFGASEDVSLGSCTLITTVELQKCRRLPNG